MNPHHTPNDAASFFAWLKSTSEQFWEQAGINPHLYGFQIQAGTRWLPGLRAGEIASFEAEVGFSFPPIYKTFLATMNGTEPLAVNVYGESGAAYRYAPAYYSFPRDLALIQGMIHRIYEDYGLTPALIEAQQVPHIMPIMGHRFLVMDRCDTHPVLSMHGGDTIAYATSLPSFLVHDIFEHHRIEDFDEDIHVPFWLKGEARVD